MTTWLEVADQANSLPPYGAATPGGGSGGISLEDTDPVYVNADLEFNALGDARYARLSTFAADVQTVGDARYQALADFVADVQAVGDARYVQGVGALNTLGDARWLKTADFNATGDARYVTGVGAFNTLGDARYVTGVGAFNTLGDARYLLIAGGVRVSPTTDTQTIARSAVGAISLTMSNTNSANKTGSAGFELTAGDGNAQLLVYAINFVGTFADGTTNRKGRTYIKAASGSGINRGVVIDGSLNPVYIDGDFQFGQTATARTASASTHTIQVFDKAGSTIYLLCSTVQ